MKMNFFDWKKGTKRSGSLLIFILLFWLVSLKQFLFVFFGNSKWVRMFDMPVNKKSEHYQNEENLDK